MHAADWQYKGSFIKGKSKPFGKHDLGAMWECPFFTAVSTGSSSITSNKNAPSAALSLSEDELYVMCVSPYPHFLKDRLTNPCLYWLGHVKQEQFMIEEAHGMLCFAMSITITEPLPLTDESFACIVIHPVLSYNPFGLAAAAAAAQPGVAVAPLSLVSVLPSADQ